MANWSDLPQDLVVSIGKKMVCMEDLISFGAVCKSWRSSSSSTAAKKSFTRQLLTHEVPFLMLPDEGQGVSRFYSLRKGNLLDKLSLPEANDKFCTLCSLGWLMTQSSKDFKLNLLHPLNHAQVELPYITKSKCISGLPVRKFALSSSPSWASNYVVMVVCGADHYLLFWRPKDAEWTVIDEEAKGIDETVYFDVTYYQGQFYVVDNFGNLRVCDIENPKDAKTRVVSNCQRFGFRDIIEAYLVESAGTLLLVSRFRQDTRRFRVFVVLFGDEICLLKVMNLGNRSLFIGDSSCSIEFADSRCMANCIYLADALKNRREVIIFSMEDGKIVRRHDLPIGSIFPSSGSRPWIQPSF